jgi:hypothetical protein
MVTVPPRRRGSPERTLADDRPALRPPDRETRQILYAAAPCALGVHAAGNLRVLVAALREHAVDHEAGVDGAEELAGARGIGHGLEDRQHRSEVRGARLDVVVVLDDEWASARGERAAQRAREGLVEDADQHVAVVHRDQQVPVSVPREAHLGRAVGRVRAAEARGRCSGRGRRRRSRGSAVSGGRPDRRSRRVGRAGAVAGEEGVGAGHEPRRREVHCRAGLARERAREGVARAADRHAHRAGEGHVRGEEPGRVGEAEAEPPLDLAARRFEVDDLVVGRARVVAVDAAHLAAARERAGGREAVAALAEHDDVARRAGAVGVKKKLT